jgi:hypothetical protein
MEHNGKQVRGWEIINVKGHVFEIAYIAMTTKG